MTCVQVPFLSLFESSTEPANPCQPAIQETAAWQNQSNTMSESVVNKAQALRAAAIAQMTAPGCLMPPATRGKAIVGRRLLADGARRRRKGVQKCANAPPEMEDALKHPGNIDLLKKKIEEAYKTGFKLTCKSKDRLEQQRKDSCMKYSVKVAPQANCPGSYRITVQFEAKKSGKGGKTRCNVPHKSGGKDNCETPFEAGCNVLSGKRGKYATYPESQIVGKCNEAEAFVKIQTRKKQPGKLEEALGEGLDEGRGNGETNVIKPLIWSSADVVPGAKDTRSSVGLLNAGKMGQAIGAFFGTGARITESQDDKQGRVCNQLRIVDDKLIRIGINAFRFELYKSLSRKPGELGETLWKLVQGNGKTYACNVRSNSRNLAKSACKLQLGSASTSSNNEGDWDGEAWVHNGASNSLVHSRTWLKRG